jgi:hypothetical protein
MIYYKIYSQNHNNFYNYIQTLWYKNIYKENTFYKQTVCFYIADKNIQMSTQSLLGRYLCWCTISPPEVIIRPQVSGSALIVYSIDLLLKFTVAQ